MAKSTHSESAEYENCLEQTSTPKTRRTVHGLETVENKREQLWRNMPAYQQDAKAPYRTLIVHFRNEEDVQDFIQKYQTIDPDQVISPKTKSLWYPHLNKDENSLKRWFEEDDEA